jgi:putative transposase
VPWGLKRFQQSGDLHFITFSCYRRQSKFAVPASRRVFEQALERVRKQYDFFIRGYVVMPEHVHLLISEPESGELATAIQSLKQAVSRRLALRSSQPFWQARYYDFNVWTERKLVEKLRYIHRNPVKRGLVSSPYDWHWSSFRHYATGADGIVEVESQWVAKRRERMGVPPAVRNQNPRPSEARTGHPQYENK